jgi:hypothetical protein
MRAKLFYNSQFFKMKYDVFEFMAPPDQNAVLLLNLQLVNRLLILILFSIKLIPPPINPYN